MDFYSITLLASMIAAALALAAAIAVAFRAASSRRRRIRLLGGALAGVSLVLVLVSAVQHGVSGHGSSSSEPMGVAAFLQSHPAVVIVVVVALLALGALMLTGRRGPQRPVR